MTELRTSVIDAIEVDDSNVVAVVDTSVMLDVLSLHDLEKHYELVGENAVDGPESIYRPA